MSEKQIQLENAVDTTINIMFERFNEIATVFHADIDEICCAIAEFGGNDLAEIYRETIEEDTSTDADEPDPDAVRDAHIAEELEGQD